MNFYKGMIPWNKGKRGILKRTGKWWLTKHCLVCDKLISEHADMCKSCSHKIENGFIPRKWSEEQKIEMSKICKGRPSAFKGHHHTDRTKEKMSEERIGIKHPDFCGDNNPSKRPEVRKKMSLSAQNRIMTEEWKQNLSKSMIGKNKGDKSGLWKGGITPLHVKIREDLKEWKKEVFKRDNYTCQDCGQKGGILNAHHIKSFADYPELRKIILNGITLCKNCHKKLHKSYNL